MSQSASGNADLPLNPRTHGVRGTVAWRTVRLPESENSEFKVIEQKGRMLRGIWGPGCSHEVGQSLSCYPREGISFSLDQKCHSTLSPVVQLPFLGIGPNALTCHPGRSMEAHDLDAACKGFESKCGSQAVLWWGLEHDCILTKRSLQGLRLLLCLVADFWGRFYISIKNTM